MDTCPPNSMCTVQAHNCNSKRATKAINDSVSLGFNFKLENLEQRTLICREGNGKRETKHKWEVEFQWPKYNWEWEKTNARISSNHENVWEMEREWELKKNCHGKRERELSGNSSF